MTAPRTIIPGRTYLITRRCTQRQFLLTPCRITNQVVSYCLALVAERTQVQVHAACFMSNHWHGIVSDPFARLPEFLELFHKLVAKAMNTVLRRRENFWASEKTSIVHLISSYDIVDKWAYVVTNPTAAGLVKSPELWPGVITRRIGEQQQVQIPGVYFDPENDMPEEITLRFTRPPAFPELSDNELNRVLYNAVATHVRKARIALQKAGKAFLGEAAILRQSVTATPRTIEPLRSLNPQIAARSPAQRAEAIRERHTFLQRYREAWLAFREGLRDVLFPLGTYALRLFAGVNIAPA